MAGTICRRLRSLRPRLRELWQATGDTAASVVNQLLHEFNALPQLVKCGKWGYRLEVAPADAPLAARFAIRTSIAVADLLRQGELRRLRSCAHPECHNVMVDLSKNRSKRYCDGRCGNRCGRRRVPRPYVGQRNQRLTAPGWSAPGDPGRRGCP